MEPATWGFIGTIFGALVGAGSSIFATYIGAVNTTKISEKSERFKREAASREFQKENLLDLQNISIKMMRLMTQAHIKDLKHYRDTNDWFSSRIPLELDENIGLNKRKLLVLSERVLDYDLRKQLMNFQKVLTDLQMSRTYEEAYGNIQISSSTFESITKSIGVRLRSLY